MPTIRQIQLGKNGLTESFIGNLKHHFDSCKNVKISVLRSCCRDREELKKINEEIMQKLGNNYTSRIIGYTIVIKKWRRDMREIPGKSVDVESQTLTNAVRKMNNVRLVSE